MPTYNQIHFEKLLDAFDNDFKKLDLSFGSQKDPDTFRKYLLSLDKELSLDKKNLESLQNRFNKKQISIEDLKKYCKSDNATIRKLISIMAWGGMKEHQFMMCMTGTHLFKCKLDDKYKAKNTTEIKAYDGLYKICESMDYISKTKLSRANIYDIFASLNLFQCGPAYFTKLMFFSSFQENSCFIMDQWTARSINLLIDDQYISMRNSQNPSPSKIGNNGKRYDRFCKIIEDLSYKISKIKEPIEITPSEVEQLIFSRGGNMNKLEWRKYVEQNG